MQHYKSLPRSFAENRATFPEYKKYYYCKNERNGKKVHEQGAHKKFHEPKIVSWSNNKDGKQVHFYENKQGNRDVN